MAGAPTVRRRVHLVAMCRIAVRHAAFLAAVFTATPLLLAQRQERRFHEYPETIGQPETFHLKSLPSWLTFDGELRGRLEGQSAISDKPGQSAAYLLTRIRGGMHVTPNAHTDFYLQFHDDHALGLPVSQTSPNMRDTFDLRQGYLNLHTRAVSLTVGRQELKFGSERLIGISDFTNNARSFDGVDLRLGDTNRIDLFSTSVVTIHPTSLDTHGKGLTFHGAYGTLNHVIRGFSLQPFALLGTDSRVTDPTGHTGSKTEVTAGGEVSGRLAQHVDVDGMLALQRGSYASQSIHAAAYFLKAAYALPGKAQGTRIGLQYDRATGDDHSDPNRKRTFNQQYPSNHDAFGLVDLFGFQNIEQRRVNIDVAPGKALSILVQAGQLNLATRMDDIYAASGSVLKAATNAGFATRQLGYEADVSMKYLIGDDLVVNAGYGHLWSASGAIANASNGYISVTYRFKIMRTP